jgi:hypothetical protein
VSATAAISVSKLAAGTNTYVLTTVAGVPTWVAPPATGVTSLSGTPDQVNVSASTGSVTLSLPQSIATTSSPIFAGLTVGSLTGLLRATAGVLSGGASVSLSTEVTGTLGVANGGTGLTASGASGNLLVSSGSAWASVAMSEDATIASTGALTLKNTGAAGTYGSASSVPVLTTDAQGRVTSVTNTSISIAASQIGSGEVSAVRGGTGQSSYAIGDLLYADTISSLARLADVATGSALISGGVGVAPSWGKIGLTTHVSGTLAVGNGGTGATSLTGYIKGNGTSAFTASASIPVADVTGAAPLASPTFTGTVTIPAGASIAGFAPLSSPTFTGTPSLPTGTTGATQSAGDSTTKLATTAFVAAAVAASSGIPYDLPCEIPGTPSTSTKVVNFKAVRAFNLSATGHQGGQLTAPSGNFVCTVARNGSSVGTITFGTSGFSSSITATSFAAGDVLSVETPASALGIDTPFFTLAMTLT